VLWAGKTWAVRAVVDGFARNRELHLYCDAGLSQG
jgi:hypothetical protein